MDYCLPYSTNVNLLYPDLQCQFKRTGMLCSQCQHPLSMIFGSSRCMKCTNIHILITIIVLVAGIVLVVLLYVLNLTVTNGTINGIIFYANIISINDSVSWLMIICLNLSECLFLLSPWIWVLRHVFTMEWIAMLKCGYNYSFHLISYSLLF